MATEFYFTPELHLKDGRIIRDLDQRDEVLHKMERAESDEEAHAAAHLFVRWLERLDILE
jgi:hypothetical protein